jgi:hypothetical protein
LPKENIIKSLSPLFLLGGGGVEYGSNLKMNNCELLEFYRFTYDIKPLQNSFTSNAWVTKGLSVVYEKITQKVIMAIALGCELVMTYPLILFDMKQ